MFNMFNKKENKEANLEKAQEEVGKFLKEGEQILDSFTFIRNYMVATTEKLIYVDIETGKAKNYSIIPYKNIVGFTFREPTGMATESRLRIMGGGDNALLEVKSNFNDDFDNFCILLAQKI